MPSNREAYFSTLDKGVSKSIIDFALQEINGFDYSELSIHLDDEIKDIHRFESAIDRYLHGEMIEYIFNKAYFLSTPFYVDKNVLIPRQETEQLVLRTKDLIMNMFGNEQITIADVCTGSGIIGLSLKKTLNSDSVYLTDISKEALGVANKNAALLKLDVKCLEGDMLAPLTANNVICDVILCNPPYISDTSTIDKKTWEQEPHLALLASPNTLFYEKLLKEYTKVVNDKFLIAFEIGEDMEESLTKLVDKYCPNTEYFFEKDLYGKTRFLFIKTRSV